MIQKIQCRIEPGFSPHEDVERLLRVFDNDVSWAINHSLRLLQWLILHKSAGHDIIVCDHTIADDYGIITMNSIFGHMLTHERMFWPPDISDRVSATLKRDKGGITIGLVIKDGAAEEIKRIIKHLQHRSYENLLGACVTLTLYQVDRTGDGYTLTAAKKTTGGRGDIVSTAPTWQQKTLVTR